MTIVDLTKARAYAATGLTCTDIAADWILSLADEVESLGKLLDASRATTQAALSEAADLAAENKELRDGLAEILGTINKIMPRV